MNVRSLVTRSAVVVLVAGLVGGLPATAALARPAAAPALPSPGEPDPASPALPSAGEPDPASPALRTPFALVEDRDVDDRLPQPEDRYALAGGCYAIEVPGAGYVARAGDELVLAADAGAAEGLHFQATRLGEYLIATNEGRDTRYDDAWWDARGYLAAATLLPEVDTPPGVPRPGEGLYPAAPLPGSPTTDELTVAARPSPAGEWAVVAAGGDPDARAEDGQPYVLSLPSTGQVLATDGDRLALAADPAQAAEVAFHHLPDDEQGRPCATWPEIETNTSGRPEPPGGSPAAEVEGFFEAHVHGMAFEFLGGELRCGRPWHPYGVEYALGRCDEDGNHYNGLLEVAVAGRGPAEPFTSYDPVGWPTFSYWPAHDTLTHEQFYWRWLERAYHGGLRLVTNLLVDNTALCQAFPVKRNSCNEMDNVRLQAQRMFELQDYVDAQSGGPGEGWLRIVTSPAQARAAINAGRLAVVLGIEVSVLFDCGEILDIPQCTAEDIDERLQEVFDMGVRQMELINKFDNALAGVTGDGGATGVVVNTGNRWVTGHWWDMQTCDDEADHGHGLDGHEHDRRQLNVPDDVPDGGIDEIDVLAGIVLEQFGPTRGYVAPAYPAGPHCNTRGLTDLGRHLIRGMVAKGMIFDPDHMSALAQREALDFIEHELVPAEQEAAAVEGRPAIQPAVISSHSWANDVIYQRIYQLDGVVAPRTSSSSGFVDRWQRHRDWADTLAPADYVFGMGYGADTNGLGSQPGPRRDPPAAVDYDNGFEAPIGGVTIHRQRSGLRTYDVNVDGVAHYGLFADWFADVALAADEHAAGRGGGQAIMADMLRGAETYLRLWERAVYGGNDCVDDQSTLQVEDLHALLGANVDGFLEAAGQPASRDGAAYVYCAQDADGDLTLVEVVFDDDGAAAAVGPAVGQAWPELHGRLGHERLGHDHHGHDLHGATDDGPAAALLLSLGGVCIGLLGRRRPPSRRPPSRRPVSPVR